MRSRLAVFVLDRGFLLLAQRDGCMVFLPKQTDDGDRESGLFAAFIIVNELITPAQRRPPPLQYAWREEKTRSETSALLLLSSLAVCCWWVSSHKTHVQKKQQCGIIIIITPCRGTIIIGGGPVIKGGRRCRMHPTNTTRAGGLATRAFPSAHR